MTLRIWKTLVAYESSITEVFGEFQLLGFHRVVKRRALTLFKKLIVLLAFCHFSFIC